MNGASRRRLTLNYGLRWEVSTPFVDIRNRMNSWSPGSQSTVFPNAPAGPAVPGRPGSAGRHRAGLLEGSDAASRRRVGPHGHGTTSIRAAYGIFYDIVHQRRGRTAAGAAQRPALDAGAATRLRPSTSRIRGTARIRSRPIPSRSPPRCSRSRTGCARRMRRTGTSRCSARFGDHYLMDVRYIGNKGTRLPRMIEANPAVYGPGATSDNADQRRLYAGCHGAGGPCDFASVGLITNSTNSTYHAGQVALSRRFSNGLAFLASYTFSKSLDYVSSFNVAGSAPRLVAGENDLAQNPFDLERRSTGRRCSMRATGSSSAAATRFRSRGRPAAWPDCSLAAGS